MAGVVVRHWLKIRVTHVVFMTCANWDLILIRVQMKLVWNWLLLVGTVLVTVRNKKTLRNIALGNILLNLKKRLDSFIILTS